MIKINTDIAYDVYDFPYQKLIGIDTIRNRHGITYYKDIATFDIETTNILCEREKNSKGQTIKKGNDIAYMYQWQMCVFGYVVFGRRWEEFCTFIDKLVKLLELSENRILVVYVHNLSFEFQFIKDFFQWSSVFAREKRKPIKALTKNGIEFRCSYILSNMSLEKFCENSENIKHGKLSGSYDYGKIRFQDTELSNMELEYCYNDVAGLYECLMDRLKEDTILSIPLTSTGYVRRDFRNAVLKNKKNRTIFFNNKLSPELYQLLKDAFRGGDTHANYLYANQLLKNVYSYDETSAYPGVMMRKKFPMHFIKVNENRFAEIMKNKKTGKIFRCRMFHVKHKIHGGMPYISISMCAKSANILADNGRVLSADFIEIKGITDIDYEIIKNEYSYEKMEIKDLYQAKLDYLPIELRQQIMLYYEKKTMLKNIDGKEYEYAKSKNRLNSSYGMIVTDIANDDIVFDGEWKEEKIELEDALNKYYENKRSFLSYQWGIWVTAYARQALREAIYTCGELGKDAIYIDTDSIKTQKDITAEIQKINEKIIAECEESGMNCFVEKNGVKKYLGTYEYEGMYEEFKTLGAKKYVVKENGKYKTTIAGLNKMIGSQIINHRGIDFFSIGSVFTPSGNLDATYNDCAIQTITIDGHTFTTASNLALAETDYTLGITNEYAELLGIF